MIDLFLNQLQRRIQFHQQQFSYPRRMRRAVRWEPDVSLY